MESMSKDDKFRVIIEEFESGWGSKKESSGDFHSCLAAVKFMQDMNAKLGTGKTPASYCRAEYLQWYHTRRQRWETIDDGEIHLFTSSFLLKELSEGKFYGYIEYRKTLDRGKSETSLIHMPDGTVYRMVHASKPLSVHYKQHASIYRKPKSNLYLSYTFVCPSNDNAEKSVCVGGYEMSWGDGDPLHVKCPEGFPDIKQQLYNIPDEDTQAFVLVVLNALHEREDLWEVKGNRVTE